jgi:hypothetical protein
METHEYHHDPLKKQIFLHNSWLCSHVFPRKMKPEVVSNFRPTKNLQLFIKKSWIFFQPSKNLHGNFLQSSLGNEKKSGSFPSTNSSPARPAQRYLPFQAMDVIEVSGSACAWWSAGTMREGLPGDAPFAGADGIGKHWENIRKLGKHWNNSGDLKQVMVRSLGYHWKKSLG